MNEDMQSVINELLEKFKEMETLQKAGDDEGALNVLGTITDKEIKILEGLGKTFTQMALDIQYFKNQKTEVDTDEFKINIDEGE